MRSLVLGKRTRSGISSASDSRNKRQAQNIEDDRYDDDNPFVLRRSNRSEKTETPQASDPVLACPESTRRTPRTRAVTRALKKEGERNLCVIKDLSEDENSIQIQTSTPQTPRKRDALSRIPPTTPRHRVALAGQPITPRSCRNLRTPGGSIITIYSQARQMFSRCSEPGPLVGREDEREQLSSFIQSCVSTKSGGCIYVSGPPGTGKSALVSEVMGNFRESKTILKLCINCMSIRTSKDLVSHLLEAFCDNVSAYEGQEVETMESTFIPRKSSRETYIIILDEIDHILTLDLEILYKLFEWALQKKSRLALIGIANALDLTDRFLPRLKARELKPQLLPFLPYTAAQIKAVIEARLKSLIPKESAMQDYIPFLHPAAIELCSRKVASQNGDLRKAFEICRRAINVIESEVKLSHEKALDECSIPESPSKKPQKECINLMPPNSKAKNSLAESLSHLTVETAPRATISHINKITSSIFGYGTNQRLKTLNLQQKAALCALVALEKRKRESATSLVATPSRSKEIAPTVKELFDVYCTLCKRDRVLHPLSSIEFKDVICSLETLSLVRAFDGRGDSLSGISAATERVNKFRNSARTYDENRLTSCIGMKEITQAVDGSGGGILQNILSGEID
ncbi:Cell division control protein 18 [Golovinomyces cichoracearum]|uniref:Cell division control protein n=1 Tax=Golovinomyces cichoracearum TaxID=62708 RepID=A0A420IZN1_9PEZI|nr:Cell division control protein 18 [Golovinomyces cichoracearum]